MPEQDPEFSIAEDGRRIAEELIPQFHADLVDVPILYIYTYKEKKKSGKRILGTLKKASGLTRWLSRGYCSADSEDMREAEYIMTLDWGFWHNEATNAQRYALVDHELCHAEVTFDDETDEPNYGLKGHDIEEFGIIVERHGLYLLDLQVFADKIEQLRLPGMERRVPRGPASSGRWHDGPVQPDRTTETPEVELRGRLLGQDINWSGSAEDLSRLADDR